MFKMCCNALLITSLHDEAVKTLHDDNSWKNANFTFTCNLWHSKCMKEDFTMTAHWIQISGTDLTLLGAVVVGAGILSNARCGN